MLCPVLGCEQCSWDGQTGSCIDCGEGKEEQDGVCKCLTPNMELHNMHCQCQRGYRQVGSDCVACAGANCLHCATGDNNTEVCVECADKSVLNEGVCEGCNVVGCESCASENVCELCIDWYWTYIIDGQCYCWWSDYEKPNSEGICAYCYVDGCASCEAGNKYKCHQCLDSQAEVEEGQCVCPQGLRLNDEGYCQQCNVANCASCETGDEETCRSCEEGFKEEAGQCVC